MRKEYTNGWYEGEFDSDGEFHGQGELHREGAFYRGGFCHGEYDGYGELVNARGERFSGHFVMGKLNGKGRIVKSDHEYEGDLVNGIYDGIGTYKCSDFTYTGQFSRGVIEGHGECRYANGDYEQGFFKNEQPHGRCTVRWSGNEYTGDFVNGVPHGSIEVRYADGRRYSGGMAEGKYHGHGRLTYADGRVVEGNFYHGTPPTTADEDAGEATATPAAAPAHASTAAPSASYCKREADLGVISPDSRFYEEAKKLKEDEAYSTNYYYTAYSAGFERAKAEVRREGGDPLEFCTWGYMIGTWRGKSYRGEKSGSSPDGFGFLSGAGYSYHGYFRNGDKCGYGTETADGRRYDGYFEADRRHGYFEETAGEMLYRLFFRHGARDTSYMECYRKHEKGESLIFRGACRYEGGCYLYEKGELFGDGCRYEGAFKNGLLDGEVIKEDASGTHTLMYENGRLLYDLSDLCEREGDGWRYRGMLKGDLCDGFGECFYHDGGYYKGEWRENCWHGRGYVKHADGSTYEGEFQGNLMHGKGRYTAVDGTVFEGVWQNGRLDGKCKITSANGSYEGEVLDCVLHGYGVFHYASGDVYEGEWQDGNWHGRCKILWKASGIRFEGILDRSNVTTEGVFTYQDGSSFAGSCINYWTWHGKGKHIGADGRVFEGEWVNGKKSGPIKQYSTRNLAAKGDYFIQEFCEDVGLDYTEICKDKKVYKGRFMYRRGRIFGYGSVGYPNGGTSYTGWILDDKKFRGVEGDAREYYDGEYLGAWREGVGTLTIDSKSFRAAFKKGTPALRREKQTYTPSYAALIREDRFSLSWLAKDASLGSCNSAYLLGLLYEHGYFFNEKSAEKAFAYYKAAAEGNLCLGQEGLGKCYYLGLGCSVDHKKAASLLIKAQDGNNHCTEGYLYLARCYRYGHGVRANAEYARYYYGCAHHHTSGEEEKECRNYLEGKA